MSPDPWAALQAEFALSANELQRLKAYDAWLLETSAHTNLVARSSLPHRWERHYRDSLQLFPLVPKEAETHLDIGSGAGFPGIILSILAQDRLPALQTTLCDSVGKKAAFLEAAGLAAGLDKLTVSSKRVETFPRAQKFDVITARAVTALPALLDLAIPRMANGGLLVFPKGQRAQQEVDAAQEQWSFEIESRPSLTDKDAAILLIREPSRRS